jgi:hypothetical protein
MATTLKGDNPQTIPTNFVCECKSPVKSCKRFYINKCLKPLKNDNGKSSFKAHGSEVD